LGLDRAVDLVAERIVGNIHGLRDYCVSAAVRDRPVNRIALAVIFTHRSSPLWIAGLELLQITLADLFAVGLLVLVGSAHAFHAGQTHLGDTFRFGVERLKVRAVNIAGLFGHVIAP